MNSIQCRLNNVTTAFLPKEPQALGYGAIILCERGCVRIKIEFTDFTIHEGESITLFPTDLVQLDNVSDDFSAMVLSYSDNMLREASMHMEESIYSALRKDRVCSEKRIVDNLIRPMFHIIKHFFSIEDSKATEEIVLLQMKSFFLGFADFIQRHPERRLKESNSQRTNELFSNFMKTLEHEYAVSRDVQYFADRLFITRKYLAIIVKKKTDKTPKQIIDEYVMTQLKLCLRNTNDSIRQIASNFNFTDDSLMIRYFKAHTGLTPVQYRRNI